MRSICSLSRSISSSTSLTSLESSLPFFLPLTSMSRSFSLAMISAAAGRDAMVLSSSLPFSLLLSSSLVSASA